MGFLKFLKNFLRDLLLRLRVRFQSQLLLFLGSLDEVICCAIRFQAHQNANLFDIFQHRVEFVESADEEVPNETVEGTSIVFQAGRRSDPATNCRVHS